MDEFDYKPNSHKYKAAQQEAAEKEKRVEKVVTGPVKVKKKSELSKFASAFISEDAKDVKSYVLTDIIVPTVKKVISDIVVDVTDIVLNGKSGRRKGAATPKVSYRNYYDDPRDTRRPVSTGARFDYDELTFANRGEAEVVLEQLEEALDRYSFVTVADLYDAAGLTAPYTSNKYGWTSLRSAEVIRTRDGYVIKLPRAVPID